MPQSPRQHPKPWTIQEARASFRIIDAENNLLAEVPFATGLGRGLSREAARQMAERMLEAGEVLASIKAAPTNEHGG